jgi:hypothetical protein
MRRYLFHFELYLGLQGPLAGLLGVLLHRDLQIEVFETLVQLVPPFSDVTHPYKNWLVTTTIKRL